MSHPPDGNERRTHKRYGVKDSVLRYSRSGWRGLLSGKSESFLILTISQGGLHFIAPEKFIPGTNLQLEITAPPVQGVIKVKAVIVWCQPGRISNAWRCGLKFVRTAQSVQQKLKHVLDNTVLEKVDITTALYFRESGKRGTR